MIAYNILLKRKKVNMPIFFLPPSKQIIKSYQHTFYVLLNNSGIKNKKIIFLLKKRLLF
ncbi:hypothetical protein FC80_GL001592 [Liquorilactobacillus cacaonum DSM 21116]|uniref:Uncharacterized protein n=1 Tax=Liquorilactobacillus cacaonum DSM 21116 TaxID=1423729 RepID=A0A0R2CM26_9LACO|nr:hypothetical protein FC80_GL001592 [Liquorilactobacillus cacaonum DSM 21116]